MRDITYTRHVYNEYTLAMMHIARALRRRNLDEVKEWLAVAERLLRMHSRLDDIRLADDKREVWLLEKGYTRARKTPD